MLRTSHITYGKKVTNPTVFIDTTVKSGDSTFSPSWDFLMEYKNSNKDEGAQQVYTARYVEKMKQSIKDNPTRWREVMNLAVSGDLVIGCYCAGGKFCHRLILKDILITLARNNNLTIEYAGEVK